MMRLKSCEEYKTKVDAKNKYRGWTGRSTHERFNEHFDKWRRRDEDSVLWKHSVEHHNSGDFPIEVKILERCFGRPTKRMITEVVLIEEMEESESMNNKAEYGYVKVPRVNVDV